MRMSDLQAKDIVNTSDGMKVGKICDIVVEEDGRIRYLVVEPVKFIKKYTSFGGAETNIRFDQIVKFGKDVILVDLSHS